MQCDRVFERDRRDNCCRGKVQPECLPHPARPCDHPADKDASSNIRKSVEPLHDVVAIRMGPNNDDENRFIDNHAEKELPQMRRLPPTNVQEANHRSQEDEEVCDAEVDPSPPDPLEKEDARESDDYEQNGISSKDAHEEKQSCETEGDPVVVNDEHTE